MERIVYDMINLDGDVSTRKYDFFILAAGSDRRAYEVLRRIKKASFPIGRLVVLRFAEREASMGSDEARDYFEYRQLHSEYIEIPCSIKDPSGCLKSKDWKALAATASSKLAIDVSTSTKQYFFTILKFIREVLGSKSIDIYYTEPKSYRFQDGTYDKYDSLVGPIEVIDIPGFQGLDRLATTEHLVVLIGFDYGVSSIVKDAISPLDVVIVNGFPAYSPLFKDISLINNDRIIESGQVNKPMRFAQANNPYDTFNVIESIKTELNAESIAIAPLGPKPMAIGACIFSLQNPGTRVVYPLPEKYKEKTSRDCAQSWLYVFAL